MKVQWQVNDTRIKLLGQITAEFPLLDALLNITLANLKGQGIQIGGFLGQGFASKRKQIKRLLESKYKDEPYAAELLKILCTLKSINERRVDITHGLAVSTKLSPDGKFIWMRDRKDKKYPEITNEFLETLFADMRATNEQMTDLLLKHDLAKAEPVTNPS